MAPKLLSTSFFSFLLFWERRFEESVAPVFGYKLPEESKL
jgi:hypothetical protein